MNNNFKETVTRLMLLFGVLKLGMPGQACAEAWKGSKISSSNEGIIPLLNTSKSGRF